MNPALLALLLGLGVTRADAEKVGPELENLLRADMEADPVKPTEKDDEDMAKLKEDFEKLKEDFEKMKGERDAYKAKAEDMAGEKKDKESEEEEADKKADSLEAMFAFHAERTTLEALVAQHRIDADFSKVDNAGMREAIVRAVNPKTPEDASPAYLEAAFDILVNTEARSDAADSSKRADANEEAYNRWKADPKTEGRADSGEAPVAGHNRFLANLRKGFDAKRADSLASPADTNA